MQPAPPRPRQHGAADSDENAKGDRGEARTDEQRIETLFDAVDDDLPRHAHGEAADRFEAISQRQHDLQILAVFPEVELVRPGIETASGLQQQRDVASPLVKTGWPSVSNTVMATIE